MKSVDVASVWLKKQFLSGYSGGSGDGHSGGSVGYTGDAGHGHDGYALTFNALLLHSFSHLLFTMWIFIFLENMLRSTEEQYTSPHLWDTRSRWNHKTIKVHQASTFIHFSFKAEHFLSFFFKLFFICCFQNKFFNLRWIFLFKIGTTW